MFHTLTVADLTQETEDCISIRLDVPQDLQESFHYVPGQYLTFKLVRGGQELRRSYSLCSHPSSSEWRVAVKRVPEGKFSGYVHEELQVGDKMEVMTPAGSFVRKDQKSNQGARYVCFAAGSGITPILSIITETLEGDTEAEIDLFYGSRKTDSIIFKEELEALKNRYLQRFQLHYVLSRERLQSEWFYGRIDAEKSAHYAKYLFQPQAVDQYFLCGPESMIRAVEASLLEAGVEQEKISYELFTAPGAVSVEQKAEVRHSLGQTESMVTITLDGLDMTFIMDETDESILDAALHQGADLPYACKGGVCSTCKARVKKGDVAMAVNYALEEDEVKAGYVLTCQAVPTDSTVAISFDE